MFCFCGLPLFRHRSLCYIFLNSLLLKGTSNLTFPIVFVEQGSLFSQVTRVIKENKTKPLSYYSLVCNKLTASLQKMQSLTGEGRGRALSLAVSHKGPLCRILWNLGLNCLPCFWETILLHLWSDPKQNL